jgi:hypothetical protein
VLSGALKNIGKTDLLLGGSLIKLTQGKKCFSSGGRFKFTLCLLEKKYKKMANYYLKGFGLKHV